MCIRDSSSCAAIARAVVARSISLELSSRCSVAIVSASRVDRVSARSSRVVITNDFVAIARAKSAAIAIATSRIDASTRFEFQTRQNETFGSSRARASSA